MNTNHHHHSRLLCRLVRFMSSCTGLPPSRHLARCEDCRAHFVAEAKLEGSLRRAARETIARVPDGLEDRILDTISYPAAPVRQSAANRRLAWTVSLAGVAAAAVVALVIFRSPDESSLIVGDETGNVAPPLTVPDRTVDTFDAWRQRIANLNPTSPLEVEIDAVYADTRSALRFLALNFLTSEPEILLPPEQRRT